MVVMSTYPTVPDMLTVIGVALLLAALLTVLVGLAARALGHREAGRHATVTRIPAQRTEREHAHAA